MKDPNIKQAAIAKLAEDGAHMPASSTWMKVSQTVELVTGRARPYYVKETDFVAAYVHPPKAAPRTLAFRPLRPKQHPRLAEIMAAQPPMMTPCGAVGNGAERSPVWRR